MQLRYRTGLWIVCTVLHCVDTTPGRCGSSGPQYTDPPPTWRQAPRRRACSQRGRSPPPLWHLRAGVVTCVELMCGASCWRHAAVKAAAVSRMQHLCPESKLRPDTDPKCSVVSVAPRLQQARHIPSRERSAAAARCFRAAMYAETAVAAVGPPPDGLLTEPCAGDGAALVACRTVAGMPCWGLGFGLQRTGLHGIVYRHSAPTPSSRPDTRPRCTEAHSLHSSTVLHHCQTRLQHWLHL